MKSKTFFSEKALLKQNLRRFAPFWGLLTLGLLMGLSMLVQNYRGSFHFGMSFARQTRQMAPVMLAYGLLMGELLFGDLFDARMCSGVHALPLRRDQIFSVNILSGLLTCILPTAVFCIAAVPFLMGIPMENGWQLAPLWFAAVNLQFLFFFGLASFCAMLAGTRLAMALIYCILSGFSVLIYFPYTSLYVPLMVGIHEDQAPFELLCPTLHMGDRMLIHCERLEEQNALGQFRLTENWGYLLVCAAIGLGLMVGALLLYRRRKLECAGDFLSIPKLKPLFQIIAGILGGAAGFTFGGLFFGTYMGSLFPLVFLAVGLIVGWFAARMLLDKTLKVFYKKNVLGLLLLAVAIGLSVVLTLLDPLGITRKVPDPQDVEFVQVDDYYSYNREVDERSVFRDPQDIEKVIRLQKLAIQQNLTDWNRDRLYALQESYHVVPVHLEYHMTDGSRLSRFYYVSAEGESGELAWDLFGRTERIFPKVLQNFDWANRIERLTFNGLELDLTAVSQEDLEALVEALKLDAENGSLCPISSLHPEWVDGRGIQSVWMTIQVRDLYSMQLSIYVEAGNTMQWMKDQGIYDRLIAGLPPVEG